MAINVQISQSLTTGTLASQNMVSIAAPGPHLDLQDFEITASGARPDTINGDAIAYHTTSMEVNDYEVQATILTGSALTGDYVGINARVNSTLYSWIKFEMFPSSTQVRALVLLDGVINQEVYANFSLAINTEYVMKLRVVGSTITCYMNGTQVISFTNNAVLSGTRAGITHYTDNLASCYYIKTWSAQNFETGTVPPSDPDPTPPGAIDAAFTVVGSQIIDPNGRRFYPVGMNVVAKAIPDPPSSWWQTNQDYVNGQVSYLVTNFGINCLRIFPAFDHTDASPFAGAMAGLSDAIDEATALGVVCVITMLSPGAINGFNPNDISELPQAFLDMQDYLCDNYSNNPYVWLCTTNEAWEYMTNDGGGPGAGWATVCNQLYTRARQRGWTNIQAFTLAQYGQRLVAASQGNIEVNFVQGKENVIIDFHNYEGDGSEAALVQAARTLQARGVALVIFEFGEHWNAINGGIAFSYGDTIGTLWVQAHAFQELKIGGLAWGGIGNHYNAFSLRQNYTYHASVTGTQPALSEFADGYGRAVYLDDTALSRVGEIIELEGLRGYSVIGGGVYTGNNGGGDPGSGGGTGGIAETTTQNFNSGTVAADVNMVEATTPVATGTIAVSSGTARVNATSTDLVFRTSSARAQNDHYAEVDVIVGAAMGNQYTGVIARANADMSTRYQWEIYAGATTQVRLLALVNNATAADYYVGATLTTGTTYNFRIECVGSTISCYIDDVLLLAQTDTNIPSGLYTGAKIYVEGAVTNSTLDNFATGSWPTPGTGGGGGGGGATPPGIARSSTPTVRRWRVRGYPVPPSVRQWIVPLVIHTRTAIDGAQPAEQNLDIAAEMDFITELQQSRRVVNYREGDRSYRVRVDAFEKQATKWSDDGLEMESLVIVKLIEA